MNDRELPPPDGVLEFIDDNGKRTEPAYTETSVRNILRERLAQPEREHVTDGTTCWCNPEVIEGDTANVIVHNYDDNWQQYAKPGETAQQCIERHRGEQDALLELLKQARLAQPEPPPPPPAKHSETHSPSL